jgi:hypothetical protein
MNETVAMNETVVPGELRPPPSILTARRGGDPAAIVAHLQGWMSSTDLFYRPRIVPA